jgi:D-glycero-D-manno-heptose 1,7-bisphosphate phosphatase
MLSWIRSPETSHRKFAFLDRDGVINVDRTDYIKGWGEYHFYLDALEALRWLREHSINAILISNQSALNRGIVRREDFWNIHDRMLHGIREAGGDLLAAYYCPHRPDEKCACRKPAPGMILAACAVYRVSMENACMIGDRETDLSAAARAGCRGILLNRLSGEPTSGETLPPAAPSPGTGAGDSVYPDLLQAVLSVYGPAGMP